MAGLVLPGAAQAEPPANDDFDAAVVVDQLPFTTSTSTVEATESADDPIKCNNSGSVWYTFTPDQDLTIEANTFGSDYDTVLSAYTGSRGALTPVPGACDDNSGGIQSRVIFAVTAGTTYHFLIGRCCGSTGNLAFSVHAVDVAPNDDFAAAVEITGLPFRHQANTTGATDEPGEPASTCGPVHESLWYSFTPATSGSVTVTTTSVTAFPVLTVFAGNSLTTLTPVDCRVYPNSMTFRAIAGQAYYLQLGAVSSTEPGLVQLDVNVAPPVQAAFGYFPTDPSTYDSVGFTNWSTDPGGAPIESEQWQFDDSTSGIGCCPAHRFPVDGDYPVSLTVTTADGRTATATRVIQVRTHDVSIGEFGVPAAARAGQTRPITVKIRNTRYDEVVTVEVYKSTPNGYVRFGELTQFVQARPSRMTTFPFNYTFTREDAAIGKVTFKAMAVVRDVRDAFPFDNEAISPATRVT